MDSYRINYWRFTFYSLSIDLLKSISVQRPDRIKSISVYALFRHWSKCFDKQVCCVPPEAEIRLKHKPLFEGNWIYEEQETANKQAHVQ